MTQDPARDLRFLRAAFALAERGLGRVWPNPAVGCLIVSGDRIVGRGWTQPGGRPHAEAMALLQAGSAARDATAYVTLEPCAHHGRTPPCAHALVQAGIARVVSTQEDPDPRVSGRGFGHLRRAGIAVATGLMEEEARRSNRGFLTRIGAGRPMVTLKLATTIDGCIATASGESRWISGPTSRRYAHLLRVRHDAILVGAGTARADDPRLDVRGMGLGAASPVRVVADGGLSLQESSHLVRTACDLPLWIAHRTGADPQKAARLEERGAELFAVAHDPKGKLDLATLLRELGRRGLTRLLCEGGGKLAAALFRAGLVDRLATVTAGRVIGADGVPAVSGLGLVRLADAPGFRLLSSRPIGEDVLCEWEVG